MSLKYVLDTNVVSEPIRPEPDRVVLRNLRLHGDELAIPAIVWHELRFGAARLPPSRRRTAIERYLEEVVAATMSILEYDRAAAEWHADQRARLMARGLTPSFADGQIAATAAVNDLVLVTFNNADFRRYQGLRILTWR